MAKISAIIPVGNGQKYLANCLDSILSQSFQDFEGVCIYYGNNQNDKNLLNKYRLYDNRIKVIEAPECNRSSAKNLGIENASGKYICFLEPDSYLNENAFVKVFEQFLQFESDFIFTNMLRYNPADENYYETASDCFPSLKNIHKERAFNESELDNNAFFNLPRYCWGKFYKKDFLTDNNFRFDEKICYEDNIFFAQTFFFAEKISYIEEFLYVSNIVPSIEKEDIYDIFKVFQLTREIITKKSLYEKYKTKLLLFEMKSLLYSLSNIAQNQKKEFYNEIKDNYLHFRIDELNVVELEKSEIFKLFIKLLQSDYEEFMQMFNGARR